jgi:hypothetical protein
MQSETPSKRIMNTLKLLHEAGKKGLIVKYVKKDGVNREFKVKEIVDIKTDHVVILTEDLEYKRLLLANIQEVEGGK